jgi:ANTAR domain-containing protein/GAF domain-containing protein
MDTHRRARLWGRVVECARGAPATIEHVCAAMLNETGADGAAVTLTLASGVRETVYASDAIATDLAELASTLGEGPSIAASAGGPVLAADLADAESSVRWPVFAPAAVESGVRAAFALPLQVGGIRLGAIDLYRAGPGRLSREQVDDALVLADTACALLIDSAQDTAAGLGSRVPERARLQDPEVHQATGMVIVQLGVSAAVALVRLRAYAYAHDRRLRDVASDVVARRLRFHPEAEGDG